MLISRGKCWIDVSERGCKLTGDTAGLELIKALTTTKPKGEELRAIFEHFGWDYEYDSEKKSMTGEGVLAFTLFQILMGGTEDQELEKSIFSDLGFYLKNHKED